MTELLLTDEEIKKALDTEVNEYFFEDKIPRYSQERAVAKAQATKAVTGVFERLDALLLAGHILENYDEDYGKETEKQYKGIKQELLDKIKEGK